MPKIDEKTNQQVSGHNHIRVDYSTTVFMEGEYCAELQQENNRVMQRNREKLPGEEQDKDIFQWVFRGIDRLRYNANAGKMDIAGHPLPENWVVLDPDMNIGSLVNDRERLEKEVVELKAQILRLQSKMDVVPTETYETVVEYDPPTIKPILTETDSGEEEETGFKPFVGYSDEMKEAAVKMAGDEKKVPEIVAVLQDQFGKAPTEQTVYKWLRDRGMSV